MVALVSGGGGASFSIHTTVICYIFASPWMPEEHCVIGPPGARAPGLTPDFFLCLYSASAARLRQLEKSDIAMQT